MSKTGINVSLFGIGNLNFVTMVFMFKLVMCFIIFGRKCLSFCLTNLDLSVYYLTLI